MKKSKLKAKASKAWILIKDCFMRCIVAFAIYVAADEAWKFGERIIEDFKMVFSGDKSGGFYRLWDGLVLFLAIYWLANELIKHFKTSKEDSDE